MGDGYQTLGFIVIVVLYLVVGLMAAAGTIPIGRKIFSPKQEQFFYAMFLILIAGFYLAFSTYFQATSGTWRLETIAVGVFVGIALPGVRFPVALIVGYSLHGLWDLLHEFQAHGGLSGFEPGRLTAIPLAYGIFCLAFDLCVASYIVTRRAEWLAGWKVSAAAGELQNQSAVGKSISGRT